MSDGDGAPLLAVDDLRVEFPAREGRGVRAVDGVSFALDDGETVALVGESGAGKTATTEAVTRILREPGEVVGGDVRVRGRSVAAMSDAELRALRGGVVAHAFQHPGEALNPVYTVGWQLEEAIHLHADCDGAAARRRAVSLLDRVDLPDPAARMDDYPHELSGGQQQRVCLAMALAGDPELLILDEPTTALDATTRASVLRLLADLQAESGFALLFVTHDLAVVASLADRVVVLYAGKVMERAPVVDVFENPAHPYTRALLACRPREGPPTPIPGDPPDATDRPDGCRFHPRCPHAVAACRTGDQPPLFDLGGGRSASCVHYGPDGDPACIDDPSDGEQRDRGDGEGTGGGSA